MLPETPQNYNSLTTAGFQSTSEDYIWFCLQPAKEGLVYQNGSVGQLNH